MIPAVGQGIIGCEIRQADTATRQIPAKLNDADTSRMQLEFHGEGALYIGGG